jgi:hypothetical protein
MTTAGLTSCVGGADLRARAGDDDDAIQLPAERGEGLAQ